MSSKLKVLPPSKEEKVKPRLPSWLRMSIPRGGNLFKTNSILETYNLNTVCEEAKCPNRMECYSRKTATFLALGKACTRACGFCEIDFDKAPKLPEKDEPLRIAMSVKELGLKHVVITMVARDDLPDEGASHIAAIIREIRNHHSTITIEVLTSDFSGKKECIDLVLEERPEIFNHNIETVRTLSPRVRHKAQYERTLTVLHHAAMSGKCTFVKSGIMVGLGETEEEVRATLHDLKGAGCSIVTIGQYLQPSRRKLRVKDFISPKIFKAYEAYGHEIGIRHMYCGPFVRSSYNAAQVLQSAQTKAS